MSDSFWQSALSAVPLFPLPNVVLFPRAVLPLHIFEERYKDMTADALEGDRLVAMALLKPGWEKHYYSRAAIEPVVCVGQIISWEKLPDGKYNFLLQGRLRARLLREHGDKTYRVAELEELPQVHAMEIDLGEERQRLVALFEGGKLARLPVARQFAELLRTPLSTPDVADLAAFSLLDNVATKQSLLAEQDVRRRVRTLRQSLEEWSAQTNPALHGFPADPGVN